MVLSLNKKNPLTSILVKIWYYRIFKFDLLYRNVSISNCDFNLDFLDEWQSFHVLIYYLYLSFGNMLLKPPVHFNWVVLLLTLSLHILDTGPLSNMVCKYFHPCPWLLFYFIIKAEVLILITIYLSDFSVMHHELGIKS
jgi:hypothetical protein